MPDPRLPLHIKSLPGGYAIEFSDGRSPIYIYGREPHATTGVNSLTLDEARALAKEVARALTAAWSA